MMGVIRQFLGLLAAGMTGLVLVGAVENAAAQTATFAGIGQLSGGSGSWCYGVSADGTMVVGDAKNSSGETVAFSYDRWAGAPTIQPLGFLDATNRESHAADVGVDSAGGVHICGWSKNSSNTDRAYHWSGNRSGGGGTWTAILPWTGTGSNKAYGLYVDLASCQQEVFVTGGSSGHSTGASERAFRYRTGCPDDGEGGCCPDPGGTAPSMLNLGNVGGSTNKWSRGRGIGYRNGEMYVAGVSNSSWGGGSNQREAFRWASGGGGSIGGTKGLDWVCTGEPWQISAVDDLGDTDADTTANADNIQVVPVGTGPLSDPDAIVISAGPDNQLKDQLNPAAGDKNWPKTNPGPDTGSESLWNAISPDARFMVGRSTYPGNVGGCFEADMRDIHNRDYTSPDNCGGIAFNWPLGFLPGHDYSEALGVSNGQGDEKTDPRTGLVVVGYSMLCSDLVGTTQKAFACFIKDQTDPQWNGRNDLWFLRHQDAGEGEPGASAASTYKGMTDLKQWLVDNDIDMTGWELREATAVSDDGRVIVGWGMHDTVEEGFIVTVEPPPPQGACCVQSGWGSGTCTETAEEECTAGTWLGPGSACDQCDFCPHPFADTDRDNDVDQEDFGILQACLTGIGGGVPAGCGCFDRDNGGVGDGDIDQDDVAVFEDCAGGPDVPLNPFCEGV